MPSFLQLSQQSAPWRCHPCSGIDPSGVALCASQKRSIAAACSELAMLSMARANGARPVLLRRPSPRAAFTAVALLVQGIFSSKRSRTSRSNITCQCLNPACVHGSGGRHRNGERGRQSGPMCQELARSNGSQRSPSLGGVISALVPSQLSSFMDCCPVRKTLTRWRWRASVWSAQCVISVLQHWLTS